MARLGFLGYLKLAFWAGGKEALLYRGLTAPKCLW